MVLDVAKNRETAHNEIVTAAVAQWVTAFASQAEGWVCESQPRQTQVVKAGSNSSTAKRLAIDVCHGPL